MLLPRAKTLRRYITTTNLPDHWPCRPNLPLLLLQWFLHRCQLAQASTNLSNRSLHSLYLSGTSLSPVESLIKCKMQDNLEFLQWTKRFWYQYYPGGDYDAVGRRKGAPVPASSGPEGCGCWSA
ncbi:hypothetical protein CONLIGDRAFT_687634 [Coniochaeta ligniaria NRRL 30616]|uniref:Uncharacterized protein n=1 Tax=Coniochaeta ligniaria NRRL 30616 TaxID=1408157 RepID=A0A1J7I4G8_9PEZI|nr:hypothetical protein CONLIGDRAFT_687634 [Coniochaeta ligniaria NRRL 30616]